MSHSSMMILWLAWHESGFPAPQLLQMPEMWLLVSAELSCISALQCQAAVAPGFAGIMACWSKQSFSWITCALGGYFSPVPVTVFLGPHLCFNGPHNMASVGWGRGGAADLYITCSGSHLNMSKFVKAASVFLHMRYTGEWQYLEQPWFSWICFTFHITLFCSP